MQHYVVLKTDAIDQDRRMRQVLAEMQCLMHGNAMNWQPSISSGKRTGGNCPPGESQPLHTIWQHKYVLAAPEDREDVIAQATDALVEARVRTAPIPAGETPEQWEERLIKDGEGWEVRDVANQFQTIPRIVLRLRVKWARDPLNGRPLEQMPSAFELAQRGLTARQIAVVLDWTPQRAQYHVNKLKQAA